MARQDAVKTSGETTSQIEMGADGDEGLFTPASGHEGLLHVRVARPHMWKLSVIRSPQDQRARKGLVGRINPNQAPSRALVRKGSTWKPPEPELARRAGSAIPSARSTRGDVRRDRRAAWGRPSTAPSSSL